MALSSAPKMALLGLSEGIKAQKKNNKIVFRLSVVRFFTWRRLEDEAPNSSKRAQESYLGRSWGSLGAIRSSTFVRDSTKITPRELKTIVLGSLGVTFVLSRAYLGLVIAPREPQESPKRLSRALLEILLCGKYNLR